MGGVGAEAGVAVMVMGGVEADAGGAEVATEAAAMRGGAIGAGAAAMEDAGDDLEWRIDGATLAARGAT